MKIQFVLSFMQNNEDFMKHKYRILEKHYYDGSVWFMPQIGDWWNGWRFLCKPHPCPDVGWQRIAYKTFEEADAYMQDFIRRDTQGTISLGRPCTNHLVATKIHSCLE